jgi:phosphatidylglycerophosphate synthase
MQDGLVDRYFNRKLSGPLTRWFIKTSITPNQITLLSFAIGLISALFFLKGEFLYNILGVAIFQFSAVLDCCDGEVARIKSMQSRLGQWLDIVCDNIVHIAVFLAIAWSFYTLEYSFFYLVLGGIASLGASLSLWLVMLSERNQKNTKKIQAGGKAAGEAAEKATIAKRTADMLTNRDFSVFLLLFAVIGKLDWFLWLTAAGTNLFWLVLLWLYQRETRLSF